MGAGGAVYSGINYMVSYGSGKGANYDLRWRTDGVVYENSGTRFADIIDGTSNTVFMSETVRSVGADFTLAGGTLPKAALPSDAQWVVGRKCSEAAGSGIGGIRRRMVERGEWSHRGPGPLGHLANDVELAWCFECSPSWPRYVVGAFRSD